MVLEAEAAAALALRSLAALPVPALALPGRLARPTALPVRLALAVLPGRLPAGLTSLDLALRALAIEVRRAALALPVVPLPGRTLGCLAVAGLDLTLSARARLPIETRGAVGLTLPLSLPVRLAGARLAARRAGEVVLATTGRLDVRLPAARGLAVRLAAAALAVRLAAAALSVRLATAALSVRLAAWGFFGLVGLRGGCGAAQRQRHRGRGQESHLKVLLARRSRSRAFAVKLDRRR